MVDKFAPEFRNGNVAYQLDSAKIAFWSALCNKMGCTSVVLGMIYSYYVKRCPDGSLCGEIKFAHRDASTLLLATSSRTQSEAGIMK
jgi:hypothetical protein